MWQELSQRKWEPHPAATSGTCRGCCRYCKLRRVPTAEPDNLQSLFSVIASPSHAHCILLRRPAARPTRTERIHDDEAFIATAVQAGGSDLRNTAGSLNARQPAGT